MNQKYKSSHYKYHRFDRILTENSVSRTIVFWDKGTELKRYLIAGHPGTTFADASDAPLASTAKIRPDDLRNRSDSYYIAVLSKKRTERLIQQFEELGYHEFEDFIFYNHNQIVISPETDFYTDGYGNIISNAGFTITLSPYVYDTVITIAPSCITEKDCKILVFGHGNSHVQINEKCKFRGDNELRLYANATLTIGERSTFERHTSFSVTRHHQIIIGKDCMFSYEIRVLGGDGHTLFDRTTGMPINQFPAGDPHSRITIDDHVWVGLRSLILNGSHIESSCVVAADSLVKGHFPPNCIIGGSPARILRENIAWSRLPAATDLTDCGDEFKRTPDDAAPSTEEQ